MLEEQQQIEQDIAKADSALTELTKSNANLQTLISQHHAETDSLEQQIATILLPPSPNNSLIQEEIQQSQALLERLTSQFATQASDASNEAGKREEQIRQLEAQSAKLAASSNATAVLDRGQFETVEGELHHLNAKVISQSSTIEQAKFQLLKGDEHLRKVENQVEQVRVLEQQDAVNQQTAEKESAEYQSLLKEYQSLEEEEGRLKAEVEKERQMIEKERKQLQAGNEDSTKELLQLQKTHDELTKLSQSKTAQIADLDKAAHQQTARKERQLSLLEKEVESRQKEVSSLAKLNNGKKEEIKREDERIAEQQKKAQKAKNYKDLIKQANSEHEALAKSKENQASIYDKTVVSKSSYSTRQTLDILQRELSRHQQQKSFSSEERGRELERLERTNKQLKERIKSLTRLSQEAAAKEQKQLGEANKKQEALKADKATTDKLLNERNSKLNEYLKHFPNHEQNKDMKKKLKIKKTDSVLDQEGQAQETRRKPREVKVKKSAEEIELQELQAMLGSESDGSRTFNDTKWYKRRNSLGYDSGEEKPIYKNHYFLAAAALLLLLLTTVANLD